MSRADYRRWRGQFGTVQHEAEREVAWKRHEYPFTHDIGELLDAVAAWANRVGVDK